MARQQIDTSTGTEPTTSVNKRSVTGTDVTGTRKRALDVYLQNTDPIEVTTTVTVNVQGSMTQLNTVSPGTAGDQFTVSLPTNTRAFEIEAKDKGTIQWAFTSGSDTNIIYPGASYHKETLDLTATSMTTLYLSINKASQTVIVRAWT